MTSWDLCLDSLNGLSVGDAIGSRFFRPSATMELLSDGYQPDEPWRWTDDTEMACGLVEVLHRHGHVDQDALAATFANRCDLSRSYGRGAVGILDRIRAGTSWRIAAGHAFDGQGSMGNGAAMRVAPLGAWYAGDAATAAAEAIRSAEVTHAHPEAIVGAAAVAVAAAEAGHARHHGARPDPHLYLETIVSHLEPSQVRTGIRRAQRLLGAGVTAAARELGNGSHVMAPDTVPFTLWVAATHQHDYRAAIHACLAARGDIEVPRGFRTPSRPASRNTTRSRPGTARP